MIAQISTSCLSTFVEMRLFFSYSRGETEVEAEVLFAELMMKKPNVFQSRILRAGLSLALLSTPSFVLAEYGDYSSQLSDLAKDTGKVESILKPGLNSGGTGDSLKEQVENNLRKVEGVLTQNKEEAEARQKLRKWTKENDKLKNLIALPDILAQKALKQRETDLQTAEGLLGRLGQNNNFVNPQDFSMNGMPNSCKKNVDFTQFMTLTQQMGSEPFKYLQGQASSLLEEKKTENKQKIQAKILDVMKHFKALANKEESEETKIDAFKGNNDIESRIARLNAAAKKGKEENKELKNDTVDIFGKFIGDLFKIQDNDKRVQQLGEEFARSIENSQRAAMMTAQQNVDQLFTNCENEVKMMKQEIENFKGQLISRGWDPNVAEADAQAQRARAANLQCTDVTQNVQALLMGFGTGGSALSDRLSRVRAEKNPTKLLTEAVSAMQDVGNIAMQVGQQLQPLMQDCADAGNGREGIKQRWQQLAGSTGGAQQGAAGAQGQASAGARGSSRAVGANSSSTHSGLVPGFGRLSN